MVWSVEDYPTETASRMAVLLWKLTYARAGSKDDYGSIAAHPIRGTLECYECLCYIEMSLKVRISANVTADFGNVTDLACSMLRGVDSRFLDQLSSSTISFIRVFGATFRSDSPLSVMR
jgi:hypothetical protein